MAAYAQFGYGYPSANQLSSIEQSSPLSGNALPTNTVPSPLSGANEASLSPSGGSTATGVTTGPLSPGAVSQNSNNAGCSLLPNTSSENAGASSLPGSQTTATAAPTASVMAGASAGASGNSCCENGRPIMTDPVSGHTVCSCQYDSARLALSSYSRMPPAGVSSMVYGTPYPSTEQNPYPSIGVDSSAFYSPLSNPYAIKDTGPGGDMSAWTSAGLQPTTGYYSYDPTLAAYGYGASYDLAARRKNATRESTATLKAWLNEHKKNPYPTKGEKIMLAIITKMTLTQVSTWFANARRRLKKENKMTWEPKNKTEDDDDAMLSDDEKDKDVIESSEKVVVTANSYGGANAEHNKDFTDASHTGKSEQQLGKSEKDDELTDLSERKSLRTYVGAYGHHGGAAVAVTAYNPYQQQQQQQQHTTSTYYQNENGQSYNQLSTETCEYDMPKNLLSRDCGVPIPATKPKIWSLADTVACKTPPPLGYLGQQQQPQQQQQQQQQHCYQQQQQMTNNNMVVQQQQQQQMHNSPLNMMNNYVNASQFSRIPMGYVPPTQGATPTNSNIYNSSASSSSSNNSRTSPSSLTPSRIMAAQSYQQVPQQQQQQRVGFPEIQPDTPPQTPPNLKLVNNSGSALNPLLHGQNPAVTQPAQITPTTAMCYTNNVHSHSHSHSHHSQREAQLSLPGHAYLTSLAVARAEAC